MFGGSQGAQSINRAVAGAVGGLRAAGVQVLHVDRPEERPSTVPTTTPAVPYVVVPYVDEMQYAYAAADFALCRCGAMTCAELAAVGLPAAYVPYPVGNGEQRFNAVPIVQAGGGLLVDDARPRRRTGCCARSCRCVTDPARLAAHVAVAAERAGARDADVVLARRVLARRRGAPPLRRRTRHDARPTDATTSGDRPEDWAAPGAALVRSAATDVVPPLAELGRVHIMGIAGVGHERAGPHPARARARRSAAARPATRRPSPACARSAPTSSSATRPAHLDDADTFVYTTAINPKHEEFAAARASGKPFLRRAAALAAALEDKRMRRHRRHARQDLDDVAARRRGAGVRRRPVLRHRRQPLRERARTRTSAPATLAIVEADESDGSFLLTRPASAVITNVEADHLENHGDLEGIFRAFEQFVDRIDPDGLLLTCADDPGARRIADYARGAGRRVLHLRHAAPTPTSRVSDDRRQRRRRRVHRRGRPGSRSARCGSAR